MLKEKITDKQLRKNIKTTDWNLFKQALYYLNYDFLKPYSYTYALTTKDKIEINYATINKHKFGTLERIKYTKNGQERQFVKVNWITPSMIRSHCTAYLYNRKLKTHHKFSDKELSEGYAKSKILALPAYHSSNIIAFDIDCHDGNNELADFTLQSLHTELANTNPVFIEKSTNGGYHIFYEFDQIINNEDIPIFIGYFNKKYNTALEARTQTKSLRLPESCTYRTGTLVKDSIKYFSTIDEFSNHILYRVHAKCSYVDFVALSKGKEIVKELDTVDSLFLRTKSRAYQHQDFFIRVGNRIGGNKAQIRLALHCAYSGYTREEFFHLTKENNQGSKDLSRWSDIKIKQECNKLYNWAQNRLIENKIEIACKKPKTFQSNKDLLSEYDHQQISLMASYLLKVSGRKSGKWKEDYHNATIHLLTEMLGYTLYDKENPKKVSKDYALTYEKKQALLQGYSFSYTLLDKVKKHYNIKTNIYTLFNDIIKGSGLFIQFKHNKLGYCWSVYHAFSRQFHFSYRKESVAYNLNKAIIKLKNIFIYLKKKGIIITSFRTKDIYYYILSFYRQWDFSPGDMSPP